MAHALWSAFCALFALAVVAQVPDGHVDCTVSPRPVPTPALCWDATRLALRVNKTFVSFNTMPSNTLNVSASLAVPGGMVLVGSTNGAGAVDGHVNGSVTLESGATLALTRVNLTITGNMTLANASKLVMDATTGSLARIIIHGCLVLSAESTLELQINASEANLSRILPLFDIPSGCVVGVFGNVSTAFVEGSSTGGTTAPPGTSCLTPVGLAILVNMVCSESTPSPPPPPPPTYNTLPPAIVLEDPTPTASTQAPDVIFEEAPVTIIITGPVYPSQPAQHVPVATFPEQAPAAVDTVPSPFVMPTVVDTGPVPAPVVVVLAPSAPVLDDISGVSEATFDWPLIWTIGGVAVGVLIVLIIVLVIAYRVKKARTALFPYHDRESHQPAPSSVSTIAPRPSGNMAQEYVPRNLPYYPPGPPVQSFSPYAPYGDQARV